MATNKVVFGNTTLIDLTDSNLATADQLPAGVTAYNRSGVLLTGNATYMSLISNPTAGNVLVTDSNGQAVDGGALGDCAYYDAQTVASGVDTVKVGCDIDLIWENSSPTSSFSAQTVAMDLSEYNYLTLVFKYSTTSAYYNTLAVPTDGLTYRVTIGNSQNSNNGIRNFTTSATGISFEAGYYNASSNNTYLVPYKVYGIRGTINTGA